MIADLQSIALALGGRRQGAGWVCRCPAHEDRQPSLSLCTGENGTLLVYCFAGCDPLDVLARLRSLGLPSAKGAAAYVPARTSYVQGSPDDFVRRIWQQAVPAMGTLVERYLTGRGCGEGIPPTLRFHPGLKHQSGISLPGMVSAVADVDVNRLLAIHRTFLHVEGLGKADVEPAKMMLGCCRGAAVHLAPAASHMAITEGIETGLSVQQATGLPTWAALSASGMQGLILPALPLASEITICADNDASGLQAAYKAAERWCAEGRSVRIAVPPVVGQDFNDMCLEDI